MTAYDADGEALPDDWAEQVGEPDDEHSPPPLRIVRDCTPSSPCREDECEFCDPAGWQEAQKPRQTTAILDQPGDNDEAVDQMGYQRLVAVELERMRARREAQRMLAAEERPGDDEQAEWIGLDDLLNREDEEVDWRIEGWMPAGTRVMLAAQRKAGKTTATGNYVRSMVDGDPWLGKYEVTPVDGTVVILDFEMPTKLLRTWLRDQGIQNRARVVVVPMRGKGSQFGILDPQVRTEWAKRLTEAGAASVVLDCVRPILDSLGLDENRDAGRFLTAFDELLDEAGVTEALVVHHMGHTGERSRGDSRLRDWPDVEWKLVRENPDDDGSERFASAYGRDVDQREQQLGFDPQTRRLVSVGGNRTEARKKSAGDKALPWLLRLFDSRDDLAWVSGRGVERIAEKERKEAPNPEECDAPSRDAVREALKVADERGLLLSRTGRGNARDYHKPVAAGHEVDARMRGDARE